MTSPNQVTSTAMVWSPAATPWEPSWGHRGHGEFTMKSVGWMGDDDIWLVVEPYPSQKWWSSSVGMMTFPTEWEVKFHGSKPPTRYDCDDVFIRYLFNNSLHVQYEPVRYSPDVGRPSEFRLLRPKPTRHRPARSTDEGMGWENRTKH